MAFSSSQLGYPPTILESFQESLPNYTGEAPGAVVDTQLSGESTKNTDPPKFWISLPEGFWVNHRASTLTKYHTYLLSAGLHKDFIYRKEKAITLLSEGDVTRAAALYLLHPVNQVMSALQPEILCLSEYPAYQIRSDVVYKLGGRIFAIVEFKKRGIILKNEFNAAYLELDKDENRRQDQIKRHIASGRRKPGHSFFAGNSLKLIKQAANYAMTHGAIHVAVFDWDHLLLITFRFNTSPNLVTRRENGPGDHCRIQTVSGNSVHLRAALLGFLFEAARNYE
ncbi:hypothetical protein F5Y12DRAFT_731497 [Xylaria sp. FL1777]|nr:hypothetical protein F5Y12DRAFT_731497 [Xylaria sp. FL1777]